MRAFFLNMETCFHAIQWPELGFFNVLNLFQPNTTVSLKELDTLFVPIDTLRSKNHLEDQYFSIIRFAGISKFLLLVTLTLLQPHPNLSLIIYNDCFDFEI